MLSDLHCAYEEGISQHQTLDSGRREIKKEPMYAVTERKKTVHKMRPRVSTKPPGNLQGKE